MESKVWVSFGGKGFQVYPDRACVLATAPFAAPHIFWPETDEAAAKLAADYAGRWQHYGMNTCRWTVESFTVAEVNDLIAFAARDSRKAA